MTELVELDQAIKHIVELTTKISNNVYSEVSDKAPIVIHQRFCSELVTIMKANPTKTPSEIPYAVDIMTAIRVLENAYPELKTL